jgi:hypothetical protein
MAPPNPDTCGRRCVDGHTGFGILPASTVGAPIMSTTKPVYLPSMLVAPRLRGSLMKIADEHCRSLTAEIRFALIEYVKRVESEQPAGKAA